MYISGQDKEILKQAIVLLQRVYASFDASDEEEKLLSRTFNNLKKMTLTGAPRR